MKEARQKPTNGYFGGKNCPRNPKQQKEKEIKETFLAVAKRKRANRELNCLLLQFHGRKSIFQLLPVIKLRCSPIALTVALERVERRRSELSMEDLVFFETFKASLKQSE